MLPQRFKGSSRTTNVVCLLSMAFLVTSCGHAQAFHPGVPMDVVMKTIHDYGSDHARSPRPWRHFETRRVRTASIPPMSATSWFKETSPSLRKLPNRIARKRAASRRCLKKSRIFCRRFISGHSPKALTTPTFRISWQCSTNGLPLIRDLLRPEFPWLSFTSTMATLLVAPVTRIPCPTHSGGF